jgi:biopolymer transport protein TolQ
VTVTLVSSVAALLVAADARGSVLSLVAQAGTFAKLVLAALALLSVLSWYVLLERGVLFRRVRRADRAFLQALRSGHRLGELRLLCAQHPESVLARLGAVGASELRSSAALPARSEAVDLAGRAMQRARVAELESLERHLSFLATTGSVAPFLGLLGTVWGVMTAFLNIGVEGSASLVVVAPGIAEALIATIAGLAAAIPAVVGYNSFVSQARSIDSAAGSFISEFADEALREDAVPSLGSPGGTALREARG